MLTQVGQRINVNQNVRLNGMSTHANQRKPKYSVISVNQCVRDHILKWCEAINEPPAGRDAEIYSIARSLAGATKIRRIDGKKVICSSGVT